MSKMLMIFRATKRCVGTWMAFRTWGEGREETRQP